MVKKFYVGPIEFESAEDAKEFCDLNNMSQTLVHEKSLSLRKLKTMSRINLPCQTIEGIDDKLILSRVPVFLREILGESDGSGYDLGKDQRDLFFVNGSVSYVMGSDKILIRYD